MDFTLCLVLLSLLPAALAQAHDEGKFSFDVDLFPWYTLQEEHSLLTDSYALQEEHMNATFHLVRYGVPKNFKNCRQKIGFKKIS